EVAGAGAARHEVRHDRRGQRGERLAVAEPRGLVGGERVHDLAVQIRLRALLGPADELGHRRQARLAGQREEPGLDQVLLAGVEDDGRIPPHQAADVRELLRREAHRVTSVWRGPRARTDVRAIRWLAISGNGRTASASPASVTG